jgi:hypothetical protein
MTATPSSPAMDARGCAIWLDNDRERTHTQTALQRIRTPLGEPGPSGSCCVLLTYQLDGSVMDMLW